MKCSGLLSLLMVALCAAAGKSNLAHPLNGNPGPFTGLPGESTSVVWITDHATTIGSGSVVAPATGPVI